VTKQSISVRNNAVTAQELQWIGENDWRDRSSAVSNKQAVTSLTYWASLIRHQSR